MIETRQRAARQVAAPRTRDGSDSRREVLGVVVDALTMTETLDRADVLLSQRAFSQHAVVNAAKVVHAARDPSIAAMIGRADIVNADGMAVVWASRLLRRPVPERVTGIDFMHHLLARAAARGHGVFFLGATADVLHEAIAIARFRYPGLVVAGQRNGYWRPEDEPEVVCQIRDASADILLIAMPSPRKESFVDAHRDELGTVLAVGVGGAFDILAGRTRRAPVLMQRLGLEWAFRLAQEPRRMARRYLVGNLQFALLLARALAREFSPTSPR